MRWCRGDRRNDGVRSGGTGVLREWKNFLTSLEWSHSRETRGGGEVVVRVRGSGTVYKSKDHE